MRSLSHAHPAGVISSVSALRHSRAHFRMCQHLMCEHRGEKPQPPSFAASARTVISIILPLAALLGLTVCGATWWLPRGSILALALAGVAYLILRALSVRSRQLSAATLRDLSQDPAHTEWLATAQRDKLELAERLGATIRIQTVSYDKLEPSAKGSGDAESGVSSSFASAADASSSNAASAHRTPRTDYSQFLALHSLLEKNYPLVHQHLERTVVNSYSLLFRWRAVKDAASSSRPLKPFLLSAHLDVVPVPDAHLWSPNAGGSPFSGRVHSGAVWGRGAVDDKNSAVAMLEAVESLLRAGVKNPRREMFIALGHDEEIGGWDGAKHIAQHLKELFVKEGRMEAAAASSSSSRRDDSSAAPLSFMLDEGLFVLSGMVPGVTAPVAMVCVAEKGYVLNEYSVEVPANLAGHASAPGSRSAIGILARALTRMEDNPMPSYLGSTSPARLMFESVAAHASWPMRILLANLHVLAPVLKLVLSLKAQTATLVRTTTALTLFHAGYKGNVLPRSARALVNHRLHPDDSVAGVQAYTRAVIGDPSVHVHCVSSLDPSRVSSPQGTGFRCVQRALGRSMPDVLVAPSLMVGNTDSHHYSSLVRDTLRFTPTRMDSKSVSMFHGVDERIGVDNLVETVAFYRSLIQMAGEQNDDAESQ